MSNQRERERESVCGRKQKTQEYEHMPRSRAIVIS